MSTSSSSWISFHFLVFFSFTLWLLGLGFHLFNKTLTSPYMDEKFHVPQAQKYCQGQFYFWDPKITTPPGLYWITTAFFFLLKPLFFDLFHCHDLVTFRFFSLLCATGMFPLLYLVRQQLTHPLTLHHQKFIGWNAFNLFCMPVSLFFYFLYYTDTLSTMLVLTSYLLAKLNYRWFSALVRCKLFKDDLFDFYL
ncbi:glucosyltransferase [Coelomomyces lativittatus]|nr:glucosyltransferase [Coelomomyces lativittatus]